MKGEGKLILLQKLAKPAGPAANLRPIVILRAARKILSIITLDRITGKFETYISPYQADLRPNKSTPDIIWTHRWMISYIESVKEEFTILGIDMSSAFDTINRSKLIQVCKTFLTNDGTKSIRLLLSKTSPTMSRGDGLSSVLFII